MYTILSVSQEHDDLNARDEEGWTSFMIACYRGHKGVVQMLLNCPENNIELNAINVDGWTAFMIVCQRGHKAVVQLPLGPFRLKHRIEYNIICCIYADLRKWSQICCQITAGTFRIVH